MKILFVVLLGLCLTPAYADQQHKIYQFTNEAQQQQFKTLTWELRCLVCQNQNLAESDASLAADLRAEVAEKIKAEYTNKEIIDYLVARYGNYILYKPPVMKSTWLLWFGPFALLVLGLMCLFLMIAVVRQRGKTDTKLSTAEQAQIQKILKRAVR
jgi:cytochrome c-type biogenesis protein CcmH